MNEYRMSILKIMQKTIKGFVKSEDHEELEKTVAENKRLSDNQFGFVVKKTTDFIKIDDIKPNLIATKLDEHIKSPENWKKMALYNKVRAEVDPSVKNMAEKIYDTILKKELKGLDIAQINAGLQKLDRLIKGEIQTKTAEELDKEIDDITEKLGPVNKKIKLLMAGISALIHDRLGY